MLWLNGVGYHIIISHLSRLVSSSGLQHTGQWIVGNKSSISIQAEVSKRNTVVSVWTWIDLSIVSIEYNYVRCNILVWDNHVFKLWISSGHATWICRPRKVIVRSKFTGQMLEPCSIKKSNIVNCMGWDVTELYFSLSDISDRLDCVMLIRKVVSIYFVQTWHSLKRAIRHSLL